MCSCDLGHIVSLLYVVFSGFLVCSVMLGLEVSILHAVVETEINTNYLCLEMSTLALG